jgi:hypothetical protein
MRRVLVRYSVKPDRVAENEELIRAVYAELGETQPTDLRYATFKLDDGVTFIHIASHETDSGPSPLTRISAFNKFRENIRDRCSEPPITTDLTEIETYRFFAE